MAAVSTSPYFISNFPQVNLLHLLWPDQSYSDLYSESQARLLNYTQALRQQYSKQPRIHRTQGLKICSHITLTRLDALEPSSGLKEVETGTSWIGHAEYIDPHDHRRARANYPQYARVGRCYECPTEFWLVLQARQRGARLGGVGMGPRVERPGCGVVYGDNDDMGKDGLNTGCGRGLQLPVWEGEMREVVCDIYHVLHQPKEIAVYGKEFWYREKRGWQGLGGLGAAIWKQPGPWTVLGWYEGDDGRMGMEKEEKLWRLW
jgi:hypothetical protein